LKNNGIACDVIALSLTPKESGDKIKTDPRDPCMLARLHRAGELTAVHVPVETDAAIRDLCHACQIAGVAGQGQQSALCLAVL
jgi:hypothetical protein